MKGCCVPNCSSHQSDIGVSMHRIPKASYRKWKRILNLRGPQEHNSWRRICSLHFEKDSINHTYNLPRLRENVVPTLLLPPKCETDPMTDSDEMEGIEDAEDPLSDKLPSNSIVISEGSQNEDIVELSENIKEKRRRFSVFIHSYSKTSNKVQDDLLEVVRDLRRKLRKQRLSEQKRILKLNEKIKKLVAVNKELQKQVNKLI